MKTILVAGINGFVGHHLARELNAQGFKVRGLGLDDKLDPKLSGIVSDYHGSCDLADPKAVSKVDLSDIAAIINLAGLAHVGASYDNPEKYQKINVAVHTTLAEHCQKTNPRVRVVAVSTGAVYGANQPIPQTEDDTPVISDGSPYALSKIAMEKALAQFKDLDIVIARPFNHIGPGQARGFIVPDLIAQIQAGGVLTTGDLSTARDYTDVRDVVRAYVLLATQAKLAYNLYNICSGKSITGQELLDTIITVAGISMPKREVDRSKIRPGDPKNVIGDNLRINKDTGWQPQVPLEQTIKDILSD